MQAQEVHYDQELDAKGLSCPMPIIEARKEILALPPGSVLKVLSTDRGSIKDFQGWVRTAKNLTLMAQTTESHDGREVYVHYVMKKSYGGVTT